MNILIYFIIIFIILNILRIKQLITLPEKYMILLSLFCLILIITLFTRLYPDYIYKNKRFTDQCFIDEEKNRLGPSKCYFDADCKGERRCSSQGKCIGKSMC